MKREYQAELGRRLMSGAPLNQREIDYQRGYFRGLLGAYAVLPKNAGPGLEKLLAKELDAKESETA